MQKTEYHVFFFFVNIKLVTLILFCDIFAVFVGKTADIILQIKHETSYLRFDSSIFQLAPLFVGAISFDSFNSKQSHCKKIQGL